MALCRRLFLHVTLLVPKLHLGTHPGIGPTSPGPLQDKMRRLVLLTIAQRFSAGTIVPIASTESRNGTKDFCRPISSRLTTNPGETD